MAPAIGLRTVTLLSCLVVAAWFVYQTWSSGSTTGGGVHSAVGDRMSPVDLASAAPLFVVDPVTASATTPSKPGAADSALVGGELAATAGGPTSTFSVSGKETAAGVWNFSAGDAVTITRLRSVADPQAIPWTPADEVHKEKILARVAERCAGKTPWSSRTNIQYRVYGAAGVAAGRWSRVWLVAHCRDIFSINQYMWEPCCNGGDELDVQLESASAKVAVERVYDLGANGVVEVQFYVRKCGVYKIGIDVVTVGRAPGDAIDLSDATPRILVPPGNTSLCSRRRWPHGAWFEKISVTAGTDVVPVQRRCDDVAAFAGDHADLRDRFRLGGWYRLPGDKTNCDGVHCDGALWNKDGWVWVSDLCRVQMYTASTLRSSLMNRKLFAWGGSSLRMSIINMLYYRLNYQPSLQRVDFNYAHDHNQLFVAYRSTSCDPPRVTVAECRSDNRSRMGWQTWERAATGLLDRAVDFTLIERTTWLVDENDEPQYFRDLQTWLKDFRELARRKAPPRASVFVGFLADENTARARHCNGLLTRHRHLDWLIEDFVTQGMSDDFFFVSRRVMSLPMHFNLAFVRTTYGEPGYGWSPLLCRYANRKSRFDEASDFASHCYKKQHVEEAVIAAWLNIFVGAVTAK